MALAGNVSTVRVTGYYVDAHGDPAYGSLRFTLSSRVNDPGGDQIIVQTRVDVTLDGGKFAVDLPATDDPDLAPSQNYYTVDVLIRGTTRQTYPIALPAALGTVDLADVLPVDVGAVAPEYVLLRLASLTDVDVTGAGDGDVLAFNATTGLFVAAPIAPGGGGSGGAGTAGQPRFTGQGPPGLVLGANPSDLYLDVLTGLIYELT